MLILAYILWYIFDVYIIVYRVIRNRFMCFTFMYRIPLNSNGIWNCLSTYILFRIERVTVSSEWNFCGKFSSYLCTIQAASFLSKYYWSSISTIEYLKLILYDLKNVVRKECYYIFRLVAASENTANSHIKKRPINCTPLKLSSVRYWNSTESDRFSISAAFSGK